MLMHTACMLEERRGPFWLGFSPGFVFGDVFGQDTGLWKTKDSGKARCIPAWI